MTYEPIRPLYSAPSNEFIEVELQTVERLPCHPRQRNKLVVFTFNGPRGGKIKMAFSVHDLSRMIHMAHNVIDDR